MEGGGNTHFNKRFLRKSRGAGRMYPSLRKTLLLLTTIVLVPNQSTHHNTHPALVCNKVTHKTDLNNKKEEKEKCRGKYKFNDGPLKLNSSNKGNTFTIYILLEIIDGNNRLPLPQLRASTINVG